RHRQRRCASNSTPLRTLDVGSSCSKDNSHECSRLLVAQGSQCMKPISTILAGAVAAFVSSLLPAQDPVVQKIDKITAVEGIAEYRLPNGVRCLLFPDSSRPVVTVNLTVLVGSRHEGYGETGMAHLLEHMVFKGTPQFPDVPKVLRDHGARFNGSTWVDRTNYFETMPASDENLEFGIHLEADRMVNSNV